MFTEDLTAFFNVSEFAETVTLHGVDVAAIFDNGYSAGNVGSVGMASNQPSLLLAAASVPASPVGKVALVRAISYRIAAHEPDGTGAAVLYLERTA
jgi:poly(3-hydroxybutyrate) depolymerase